MLTKQRQELILEYVNEQGSITVTELKELLDTSESTIRRDITALDAEGKLTKVFGGAVRIGTDRITTHEDTMEEKSTRNIEEKRKIARHAVTLIQPKDCIYLDAGTTTEAMLDFIEVKDVTVVTNAVTHARRLAAKGIKVILVGGELKAVTLAVVGAQAAEMLQQYHFTKGFFGTNGLSRSAGCTTPDINEAVVKRIAMTHCKEAYVLCDYSKFDQVSSVTFAVFDRPVYLTDRPIQGYEDCVNVIAVP